MQINKKGFALSLGLKVSVFGPRKFVKLILSKRMSSDVILTGMPRIHAANTEPFPPHHHGSDVLHWRLLFSLIISNFDIQSYCYCSCYFQFLNARGYFRLLIRIKWNRMSTVLLLLGHSNCTEIRTLWRACPVPGRLLEFSEVVATQGVMGRTWSLPLCENRKIENLKNRLGTRQVARANSFKLFSYDCKLTNEGSNHK